MVIDALASATSALFYCHCHTDLARAGTAALIISDQTELAVDAIAQLDLRHLESLTLVACASGQPNPFVGPISVGHAAALAGARQLVFSLWPITAAHGARFVSGLLDDLASGGTAPEYLAALHMTSPLGAAPFGAMRL
jgi:CHAT domain-containing protein